MYNKISYEKNKKKWLEYQQNYRKRNHAKILAKRREYDKKNREKQLLQKRIWKKKNKEKIQLQNKKYLKKYYQKVKNQNWYKERKKKYDEKYAHSEKRKIWLKEYRQRPEVKERINRLERIRRKANPKSNRRATIELQIAMNNVRLRDNQRCQWQNCKKTFRDAPIHVHHIFPKNEYPQFELVESYMICYCANHHGLFHRYRGDHYSEMITARYQESVLVKGRN